MKTSLECSSSHTCFTIRFKSDSTSTLRNCLFYRHRQDSLVQKMAERPIKGWIWPRDKPYQGGKRGRRRNLMGDVFNGQGPDIFIGRIDTLEHQPTKSRWSRWADIYPNPNDRGLPAMPCADRRLKRYDFLTRRYTNFRPNMWSDVEWDYDPYGTLYQRAWWDADGHRHDNGPLRQSGWM